ncbi:hypothetical protein G9A89_023400 [Geosiphon pyriformis]|nr:hypothetical protein G9A89_023400 [Geosiphon pyriformis]
MQKRFKSSKLTFYAFGLISVLIFYRSWHLKLFRISISELLKSTTLSVYHPNHNFTTLVITRKGKNISSLKFSHDKYDFRFSKRQNDGSPKFKGQPSSPSSPYPQKKIVTDLKMISFLGEMAMYANLGYCLDNNEVGKAIKGRTDIKADVFIDSVDRVVIAYFKGPTLTLNNWKNRRAEFIKYKTISEKTFVGAVDAEWYKNVLTMTPLLLEKIKYLLTTENPYLKERPHPIVYFTGHGIGGAFAILAALEFLHSTQRRPSMFPKVKYGVQAITFGQPRIGTPNFAEYINKHLNVFRVTHTDDFVPQNGNPRGEFEHHELEYWISEPDCHCDGSIKNPKSLIEYDKALFICHGVKRNIVAGTGENLECNAGQPISNNRLMSPHYGPYFNIKMRECFGGDL